MNVAFWVVATTFVLPAALLIVGALHEWFEDIERRKRK